MTILTVRISLMMSQYRAEIGEKMPRKRKRTDANELAQTPPQHRARANPVHMPAARTPDQAVSHPSIEEHSGQLQVQRANMARIHRLRHSNVRFFNRPNRSARRQLYFPPATNTDPTSVIEVPTL